MIPVAGSADTLNNPSGRLDLTGAEERRDLIRQHDLEDTEKPGFDNFIDWAIEQCEARRQYLAAQCAPIFPTIL